MALMAVDHVFVDSLGNRVDSARSMEAGHVLALVMMPDSGWLTGGGRRPRNSPRVDARAAGDEPSLAERLFRGSAMRHILNRGAILRSSCGSYFRRTWDFDDATFDRTAASFDNPDYVRIVIHDYRWRLSLAEGESKYDDLEKRLAEGPVIAVPPSPWMVIRTVLHRPRTEHPMQRNSRVNARTASSRASVTICLKKLRRPLPKRSSMSTVIHLVRT